VSVAMIAPYSFMNAWILMLQGVGKVRQGKGPGLPMIRRLGVLLNH
jgi:hypothetical protein